MYTGISISIDVCVRAAAAPAKVLLYGTLFIWCLWFCIDYIRISMCLCSVHYGVYACVSSAIDDDDGSSAQLGSIAD